MIWVRLLDDFWATPKREYIFERGVVEVRHCESFVIGVFVRFQWSVPG